MSEERGAVSANRNRDASCAGASRLVGEGDIRVANEEGTVEGVVRGCCIRKGLEVAKCADDFEEVTLSGVRTGS